MEDQRAQLGESGQRLEPRPAVGAQVEVAHLGQLLEQRQVAEVQTKRDRAYFAGPSDDGRGVGVVVARVPEPAVGFDCLDQRRWEVGRLG